MSLKWIADGVCSLLLVAWRLFLVGCALPLRVLAVTVQITIHSVATAWSGQEYPSTAHAVARLGSCAKAYNQFANRCKHAAYLRPWRLWRLKRLQRKTKRMLDILPDAGIRCTSCGLCSWPRITSAMAVVHFTTAEWEAAAHAATPKALMVEEPPQPRRDTAAAKEGDGNMAVATGGAGEETAQSTHDAPGTWHKDGSEKEDPYPAAAESADQQHGWASCKLCGKRTWMHAKPKHSSCTKCRKAQCQAAEEWSVAVGRKQGEQKHKKWQLAEAKAKHSAEKYDKLGKVVQAVGNVAKHGQLWAWSRMRNFVTEEQQPPDGGIETEQAEEGGGQAQARVNGVGGPCPQHCCPGVRWGGVALLGLRWGGREPSSLA